MDNLPNRVVSRSMKEVKMAPFMAAPYLPGVISPAERLVKV